MRAVGWIMVAVPLFTCGLLSFVPSAWVAYMRREDRKLMTRSVLFSGLFLVTLIGGFVLVGSAPKNAEGSPEGVRGTLGAIVVVLNVVGAMGLALIQHNPTAALEDRRRA